MYDNRTNKIMQKLQKERSDIIVKLIGNKHGRVLDIGCRYGLLEHELEGSYDYYGIDFIRYNPAPKKLKLADLNKNPRLSFPDKHFDIVVATEIIEHLFFIDEIYNEIYRVLKDDGIAIISLPNDFQLDKRLYHLIGSSHGMATPVFEAGHHWMFDVNTARKFLEKKFDVVEQVNVYASRGARLTPCFVKNFLANYFPSLFSSNQVYKLIKK